MTKRRGRPSRDRLAVFRAQPVVRPLPSLPYVSREDYCDRTGRVLVWRCPQSGKRFQMHSGCDKLDCSTCYPRVAKKRGRRAYGQLGGAPLGAFVFTVPHELRACIGLDQAAELQRLLADMLKAWALDRWRCEVGFRIAFHPSGDRCERCNYQARKQGAALPAWRTGKCPRCGAPPRWLPHFDVVMPMRGLRRGQVYRIPYLIAASDLEAIKAAWSRVMLQVSHAAGAQLRPATVAQLGAGLGVVDYRFRLQKKHKLHRLRYSLRPFPAWSATLGRKLQPRAYGLAAPNARTPGIAAWRKAVSGHLSSETLKCSCCPQPVALELDDLVSVWSYRYRAYESLPWLSGGDP